MSESSTVIMTAAFLSLLLELTGWMGWGFYSDITGFERYVVFLLVWITCILFGIMAMLEEKDG